EKKPDSLEKLADYLHRDYQNVKKDAEILASWGIIELQEEKPVALYEKITLEFPTYQEPVVQLISRKIDKIFCHRSKSNNPNPTSQIQVDCVPSELRQIIYRKLRELHQARDSRDLRNVPSNHYEKIKSGKYLNYQKILREDFLLPLQLAPEKLAQNIKVDPQIIHDLINEKRDLDKDLATRLALYFDM
ncbi:8931_t:CDS:2, partial [Racocetra persica]